MLMNIINVITTIIQLLYCVGGCLVSVASVILLCDLQKSSENPLVISAILNKINIPIFFGNIIIYLLTIIKRQYLHLMLITPLTLWHIWKIWKRSPYNYDFYESTKILRRDENKKYIREWIFKGGYYSMMVIIYSKEFF
ncbi:Cornichon family-containing protein [Strongyloides ratti]|uniref:Cornichon family-containing protein n=1 Tax=Strongyloides ratti TaxID=34506 RepID=A0A090LKK8_STRRB|nr:Cornichon family-containing protein [Strongyloides ratti]CEF70218.1 Cornichon family-containing protein [Strongyloides ratti]